jgi:protoporphyrinogen oxidase
MNEKQDVIIFGAGPAGLAAGIKLTENNKSVLIFEKDKQVGGISKTLEFKGYRFDLGGHRFFSKSKEVNDLWEKTLGDKFLERPRLSRMYYKNKFFSYPVKPFNALWGLGIWESVLILFSYLKIKLKPYKQENNFEQWVSNRFGKRLYNHFFKSYTEKLWGIPCQEIQAEWAAQRIKGLSLTSAVKNAIFPDRKGTIKTLIDRFKYPKLGPGMMYDKMAQNIEKAGSKIFLKSSVERINRENNTILSVEIKNESAETNVFEADYFFSSMPITELIKKLNPLMPECVVEAAKKLKYRSFITISIILDNPKTFPDTWIYIHSPEVKMGRIQNFKNWSPFMIPDKTKTALGLEYFCTEGDDLWNTPDEDLIKLGLNELEKLKLGVKKDFVDGFVVRVPKAYPVYDSTYRENIDIIRTRLKKFNNLQPIGRYGMFKYNNMDHSILTGLYSAENVLGANHDIWKVNADQEYHETKK